MTTRVLRQAILVVIAAAAAFALARGTPTNAAVNCTKTWTGSALDHQWQTSGNWSPAGAPGPTDFGCVPSSNTEQIVFTGTSSIKGVQDMAAGSLLVNGNLSLTDTTQPSVIRSLVLQGGTLAVAAGDGLTLPGVQQFAGGSLSGGTITVPAGARATLSGTSVIGGAILNLNGTTTWASNSFCLSQGSVINNGGTFTAAADNVSIFDCLGGTPSVLHNLAGGTFSRTGTAGQQVSLNLFDNDGSVLVGPGNLAPGTNSAGPENGATTVAANATLVLQSSTRAYSSTATIGGAGIVFVNENVTFAGQTLNRLNLVGGTVFGSFSIPSSGTFNWTGGTLDGGTSGTAGGTTLTVAAGGILNIGVNGATVTNGKTLTLNGTTNWTGGNICLTRGAAINNAGTFTDGADNLSIFDCTGSGTAPLFNDMKTGTLTKRGPGTSSINVAFANAGTLNLPEGVIRVNGNYSPSSTATLAVTVAGATPGLLLGQLQVSGTGTLAGTLSITTDPAFSPALGQTFTIVTCTTCTGKFSTLTGQLIPPSNTNAYAVMVATTNVTLTVKKAADLKITGSAPSSVTHSTNFTYSLTVTNLGPNPASTVTVTDTLPTGVTFVSASVGCSAVGLKVTCSLGTMASGATVTVTITVTAPNAPGTITNTASVKASSATVDVTPADDKSTQTTTVT